MRDEDEDEDGHIPPVDDEADTPRPNKRSKHKAGKVPTEHTQRQQLSQPSHPNATVQTDRVDSHGDSKGYVVKALADSDIKQEDALGTTLALLLTHSTGRHSNS